MQGIYAITNVLSDTVYYGHTRNIKERLYKHKSALKCKKHANPHLQSSYNKYGINAFVFAPVQLVENEKDLVTTEQWFMDNAYAIGLKLFNYLPATNSRIGMVTSEETKKKISLAHKGRIFSEEWKNNISKAKKGHTVSEQTIQKMKAKLKGRSVWNCDKTRFPREEIKLQYSQGFTQKEIADKYKAHPSIISRIITGRTGKGR